MELKHDSPQKKLKCDGWDLGFGVLIDSNVPLLPLYDLGTWVDGTEARFTSIKIETRWMRFGVCVLVDSTVSL
jgi:hypothetical protein